MGERYSVGVVGARGYTGAELLRLLNCHPRLDIAFAASRRLAGRPVPQVPGLAFESIDADAVAAREPEAVFLALPDGMGQSYVDALDDATVIVDISSDHRFDDRWAYGLPELRREKIAGARRIANPGCYATAMQLTLAPFIDDFAGVPAVFGVSGFSGAGTTPGPRNDPQRLDNNLMPYQLIGHNHERETSRQLGRPVRFMPHVHPAFRGLLVTSHIPVGSRTSSDQAMARLREHYEGERLIDLQEDIPELRDGIGRPGVLIGGADVSDDGRNIAVVAVEDNLLKGAAVQAVQNLNLALGMSELTGLL